MISIINSLSEDWWHYFSLMQIHNTLFLLALLFTFFVMRKHVPTFINIISLVVLLKLAIPPFINTTVESFQTDITTMITTVIPSLETIYVNPSLSIYSVLFLTWLFIVVLFSSIVTKKIITLYAITKHSRFLKHISLEQTKIPVLVSNHIKEPLVMGFFQYKILLPEWVLDMKVSQQEFILQHEVAHIYFNDHWLKIFELLFTLIYMPNPFVVLLFNKIALFRELRSDDWAIQKLHFSRRAAAEDLVCIAEKIKDTVPYLSPAIGFMQSRSSFYQRIQFHLFRKEYSMYYNRFIQCIGLCSIFFLFILCSCDLINSQNTKTFNISEVDKMPKLLNFIAAEYPESAKENGIEGRVTVKIYIDEKGAVEKAEIIKSVPEFDQAALDAAQKCTFSPATKDGIPVKFSMNIPFSFKLNEEVTKPQNVPSKYYSEHFGEPDVYDVTQVDEAPKLIKEKTLSNNDADKGKNIMGVGITVLLDKNGNVQKAEVSKSVPEYDNYALEKVKKFKYTPAKIDGKPIKVAFPIIFLN